MEQPGTTTTDAPTVRFKKRQAKGDWVLSGPETLVVEGPVTVTKRNGKTSVEIVLSIGASFNVDGVLHRYGYLKPKTEGTEPKPVPAVSAASRTEADFLPDDFQPDDDAVGYVPTGMDENAADWDF